jgi:hypothetical protein
MRFEPADVLPDGRVVSPSAERNKGPIAEVLMGVLPERGDALEISSGASEGLELQEIKDMPANNFAIVFRKQ